MTLLEVKKMIEDRTGATVVHRMKRGHGIEIVINYPNGRGSFGGLMPVQKGRREHFCEYMISIYLKKLDEL